jgi:hypothetical protein
MPIGSELLEIAPQILEFPVVLDADKNHLGAGNFGARIFDVLFERFLVPGDAGVLVYIAVTVTFNRAGLATIKPVEERANLVGSIFADAVAWGTFSERSFASGKVLCQNRTRRCCDSKNCNQEMSYG